MSPILLYVFSTLLNDTGPFVQIIPFSRNFLKCALLPSLKISRFSSMTGSLVIVASVTSKSKVDVRIQLRHSTTDNNSAKDCKIIIWL